MRYQHDYTSNKKHLSGILMGLRVNNDHYNNQNRKGIDKINL